MCDISSYLVHGGVLDYLHGAHLLTLTKPRFGISKGENTAIIHQFDPKLVVFLRLFPWPRISTYIVKVNDRVALYHLIIFIHYVVLPGSAFVHFVYILFRIYLLIDTFRIRLP